MITILGLLGGCASGNRSNETDIRWDTATDGIVFLTDETHIEVMAPVFIEKPLDELQKLIAIYGDREFSMTAYIVADEMGIRMICMGEMGQELFDLDFSSQGTFFSGIIGTGSISPEYIVMDLQLVYYKAEALRKHLDDVGLKLIVQEELAGQQRTVHSNGKVVIEILRNDREVIFENHLRGYRYSIIRESNDG